MESNEHVLHMKKGKLLNELLSLFLQSLIAQKSFFALALNYVGLKTYKSARLKSSTSIHFQNTKTCRFGECLGIDDNGR